MCSHAGLVEPDQLLATEASELYPRFDACLVGVLSTGRGWLERLSGVWDRKVDKTKRDSPICGPLVARSTNSSMISLKPKVSLFPEHKISKKCLKKQWATSLTVWCKRRNKKK